MRVVFGAVCKLIPGVAVRECSLKALERDTVAVVVHLEVVLELDKAVDVETLAGIAFETLGDYRVRNLVNGAFGRINSPLHNVNFGLFDTRGFEWIILGHEVVQAAAQ